VQERQDADRLDLVRQRRPAGANSWNS
jgi:hypothetical protein